MPIPTADATNSTAVPSLPSRRMFPPSRRRPFAATHSWYEEKVATTHRLTRSPSTEPHSRWTGSCASLRPMSFPETRPRRLRRTPALRRLVRETTLSADNFIYPLFVCPGKGINRETASLPGQFLFSVDELAREAEEISRLGIPGVILFGLPEKKDDVGSEAWHGEGVVQRAIRAIKKAAPDLMVSVDACFCEYTTHGHCGVVMNGQIDNDATLENLGRAALSYARAGADLIAPSGMMDGYVGFLRESLDEDGFEQVGILAYAAKYASAYYGPFREAVDSAPSFGDRSGYQMDPANVREAIREVALDVEEGADIVMVKPALAY